MIIWAEAKKQSAAQGKEDAMEGKASLVSEESKSRCQTQPVCSGSLSCSENKLFSIPWVRFSLVTRTKERTLFLISSPLQAFHCPKHSQESTVQKQTFPLLVLWFSKTGFDSAAY
jgi:hypothetical protein